MGSGKEAVCEEIAGDEIGKVEMGGVGMTLYRYWGTKFGMQATPVESLKITLHYLRVWPVNRPLAWFIQRDSDGVILAQSKGFKP